MYAYRLDLERNSNRESRNASRCLSLSLSSAEFFPFSATYFWNSVSADVNRVNVNGALAPLASLFSLKIEF